MASSAWVRRGSFVMLAICLALASSVAAAQEKKGLAKDDLNKLIELEIDDATIVSRIEKGLAFEVDDAVIEEFKKAKASDKVIRALEGAGKSRTPPANAITYEDVLKLVTLFGEDATLKRLEKSPTVFTLGADQVEELKKAGASDKLIAALQGKRAAEKSTATGGDITDIAILLDCSGSMMERTSEGETKMAVAQKVVADLVRRVPDGLRLTFIVYGHDKELQCRAVKVLRPISDIDPAGKAELAKAIAALRPEGSTPIGLALQTAAKELAKNDAFSGVVLVSDGKETCNGNPVAEATALARTGKVKFGVNVIGFDVSAEERASLEDVAEAGKGKYYNAKNADELASVVNELGEKIGEVVAPTGPARRAVQVAKPKMNMPPLEEVFLVEAGNPMAVIGTFKLASIGKYGEEFRIPSASKKYDLIFQFKGGQYVRLAKDRTYAERKLVVVRPDEHAGIIVVKGEGKVDRIMAVASDTPKAVAGTGMVQRTAKYGEPMVVPAGKYDIYVDDNLIEDDMEVKAGEVYPLE
jgi:hypothetical protein